MAKKRSMPTAITLLMIVIVIAAIGTWLVPAGQYSKLSADNNKQFVLAAQSGNILLPFTQRTLDSLSISIRLQKFIAGDIRKPVSVPNTFQKLPRNPQGVLKIIQAPVKGITETIDIILFVLFIGGFMFVINETGAILKGITYLAYAMKGRESMLIILLVLLFALMRASYGMEEESLIFYPVLVPLFLAAGYDLLVPLAVIYGGMTIGGIFAFSNPFSTIIASNAAGINWMDGLPERLVFLAITAPSMAWYIIRYANKVKKDPSASLVFKIDGVVKSPYEIDFAESGAAPALDIKTKLLLLLYLLSFVVMIAGIVFLNWWTLEMSALFLAAAILVAVIDRMNEKIFVAQFVKGAESLLSVALIIGIARGITIILNEGNISDSILFYASGLVQHFPPVLFILLLLVFYLFFSLLISSSSGMAVLTMPIIGALAILINIPGREIVNSYLYGMNIMYFLSPTTTLLPSLAMVNVSYSAWIKFIMPVVVVLIILCSVLLIVNVTF